MPEFSARAIHSRRCASAVALSRHGPQESEIFLHVVCGSQGFVDGECLFEAGSFVAVISEVFGILQEQPTGTFEDILLEKVSSFPDTVHASTRSVSRS